MSSRVFGCLVEGSQFLMPQFGLRRTPFADPHSMYGRCDDPMSARARLTRRLQRSVARIVEVLYQRLWSFISGDVGSTRSS